MAEHVKLQQAQELAKRAGFKLKPFGRYYDIVGDRSGDVFRGTLDECAIWLVGFLRCARPASLNRNPAGDHYEVRYVHKISPKASDVMGPVKIPGGAFSNKNTLAKALRTAKVLPSGGRITSFRAEGEKIVVFPAKSVWHAIILIPTDAGPFRSTVDYPGMPNTERAKSNPARGPSRMAKPDKHGRHPKYKHLVMFEIEPHHGSYILTANKHPGDALISQDDAREMFGKDYEAGFGYLTDEYLQLLEVEENPARKKPRKRKGRK